MTGVDVTLEGVGRRLRGTAILTDLSLRAPAGQVTALLGPSGSGKSTLLRIIAGLEAIDAGAVRLGAEVVATPAGGAPPEARGVGVVFQDYALFPHLSALDNVAFGVKGGSRAARLEVARGWLDRAGLAARADAFPHALSGGEQQRVALARALAAEPRAVLLDEPFSGLDPVLRASLRDLTLAALRASGATAIFVTHDADEALLVADRLAILNAGRLIQEGPPREVYDRPTSLDAAAALGPVNVARGRVAAGVIATPFGAVAAPDLAEGCEAIAAVRAEALRMNPGAGAQVLERRPLGALDLVTLEAGGLVWRALAPPRGAPLAGETARPVIDPNGAFAFPA